MDPHEDPMDWLARNHREELTAARLRVERAEREGDPRAPACRRLYEAMVRAAESMLAGRERDRREGRPS